MSATATITEWIAQQPAPVGERTRQAVTLADVARWLVDATADGTHTATITVFDGGTHQVIHLDSRLLWQMIARLNAVVVER